MMKRLTTFAFMAFGLLSPVETQADDYNILAFGAKSDTTVLSTEAIQQAIDACSASGGGRVVVPAGQYKTGTIVLRSHVNLHIETGAVLYGSTRISDYRPMISSYKSLRTGGPTVQLIYADSVSDVALTGNGTIDGRGAAFPKLSWNDEGITRPHLLRFIQSSDIRISDLTLRNSGCWMQHYLACDRLQIHGIKVYNRNNYNNDALDLDGCHDVTVNDLFADSDDDGITLKSTSPRLCENINIRNCRVSSHCNAIKLGTETNGGFRNITIQDCTVKPSEDQLTQYFGHEAKRGTSAISLEITDGGVMENVVVQDITVEGTESPIFIRLGNRARPYSADVPVTQVGKIRGVRLSNISVTGAGPTGCSITGLPGHPVEDIRLSNIIIRHAGGQPTVAVPADEKEADYPEATMWGVLPARGFFVRHARNVEFHRVQFITDKPDQRPEYVKIDCADVNEVRDIREVKGQTLTQQLDSLKREIDLHPESTDLRLKKAAVNIELAQWDYAVEEYDRVLRLDPHNLAALFYRAYCHTSLRRYPLARQDYETLLRQQPRHLEARLGLATVCEKSGRHTEAFDHYNLLVQQFPDSAICFAARAAYETSSRQYDAALYDWDQAITLQPQNADYVVSKVDVLLTLQRQEEARKTLNEALHRGIPRGILLEWFKKVGRT